MVVYILWICPVTPVSSAICPWIAIAPTAGQKYEIVRVESLAESPAAANN
jgi:hypothetical protein